MPNRNPNSILFLYEGATEPAFYNKIFNNYLPHRRIRIRKKNLYGISNITKKVASQIERHLLTNSDENHIHVFVAYDREGPRIIESKLNTEFLIRNFVSPGSGIQSINEIIATQDLESWLFFDIEGIFNFLRVPKSKRNVKKYRNTESIKNYTLAQLFKDCNRTYFKGERVENFLDSLDIDKIYANVPELQKGIELMLLLC